MTAPCPTTCLCVPFVNRNPNHRFTVGRNNNYPAYVADEEAENIRAVAGGHTVTIPSAAGPAGIRELFTVLADVWEQGHAGSPEPTYLYVDFGDVAEGFAVLIPSEEGWKTLKALGAHELRISDLEG